MIGAWPCQVAGCRAPARPGAFAMAFGDDGELRILVALCGPHYSALVAWLSDGSHFAVEREQ